MKHEVNYLTGLLGIAVLLSLSAHGSCVAMSECGAAASLHSSKQQIITLAYIAMIMCSTVFFYAFILSITIMNQILDNYTFDLSFKHLLAGLIFGLIGKSVGEAMRKLFKFGFRRVFQKPAFFSSFLISLVSLEVVLILGFLCSLMLIFKTN